MPTSEVQHPNGTDATAAQQLLQQRVDQTNRATEVIDRDPEEAKDVIAPLVQAAPNVGEITQGDMFRLMSQMQQQMAAMQQQIVDLMVGRPGAQRQGGPNLQQELADDQIQRKLTLEAWRTEPREPVFINPDQDEAKIYSVVGQFPPRIFRINGLEFPITVGEIVNVPESIAVQVRHTQRVRPMNKGPQALHEFADPAKGQFLAMGVNIESGRPGVTGEGRLVPDGLPPNPQPLGLKYDSSGH